MENIIDRLLLTKQIGGLNHPVSRLFFGTASAPVSTDKDTAPELLDRVLECGINAFDCARSYGKAEIAIGKWMESRRCREQVTILSKCGDIRDGVVKVNRQLINKNGKFPHPGYIFA